MNWCVFSDLECIENEQFSELNEVIQNALKRIEERGIPDSSKAQMKRIVERFETVLKEDNFDENMERLLVKILDYYVRYLKLPNTF